LIVFLVFTQMFGMFATDMYSPALPMMATYFSTNAAMVNLTIAGFFAFQLLGMLVFGPISDKFGRKPALLFGAFLFTISSLGCIFAPTIELFLALRLLQAIAGGAGSVVSMAVIRDCFDGSTRENVLLWMQAIFVLGPIAAPLIGGQLLLFFSWRATFVVLTILGAIGCAMTFIFQESLPAELKLSGSVLSSFRGIPQVFKDRAFIWFMAATMACSALPFTAYLMVASYIYETGFGLTPQQYSYMFGLTVAISALGLPLFKFLRPRVNLRHLTTFIICVFGVMGVAILVLGLRSVWAFFACVAIIQIFGTVIRPYTTNILLGMCTRDIGAASSVMNCSFSVIGLVGTIPVLAINSGHAIGVSILYVVGAVASGVLWIGLLRSRYSVPQIKD
jgi:DHA1 family bicyclomycin/chloramphenicol resistance-like MFS transporter